jgi:acyl carrier protein
MTREEILDLVRSHLSSELEIEPARVDETTRFKEDLDADSLDLVTLVMELEDRYGVRIPDEEAARIATVGQALDYILAHAPQGAR